MQSADVHNVAERYLAFADDEAHVHSETYAVWARGVASDDQICRLISTLSPRERQPNLLFGVVRLASPEVVSASQQQARPDEYHRFRTALLTHWHQVVALAGSHHTQTNEAARIAALLPALAAVHRACGKPLALVELGASAGLLLHPDVWSYRYHDPHGTELIRFAGARAGGTSATQGGRELAVKVRGQIDLPATVPMVDWRVGVDRNPLDPRRPEVARWLRTLVWPGQVDRLARLDTALRAAAADPVLVVPRDLSAPGILDEIVGLVPTDLHPVVFHCAVQAYLPVEVRSRLSIELLDRSRAGDLSWISYEGSTVVPQIEAPEGTQPGDFVVAVDGAAQYLADGHASWIRSLDESV